MRNAFRNQPPQEASINTQGALSNGQYNTRQNRSNRNNRRDEKTNTNQNYSPATTERPKFYAFKSSPDQNQCHGAIVDSGACGSVVGQSTLDDALRSMGIQNVPDGKISRECHRFGNHPEPHKTKCAVKIPFQCLDESDNQTSHFDIMFDVIPGTLPFLIGLPTLLVMRSCLNFKFKSLGLARGGKYSKIPLNDQNSHLILPFRATIRNNNHYTQYSSTGSDNSHVIPQSHYQPSPQNESKIGCYSPELIAIDPATDNNLMQTNLVTDHIAHVSRERVEEMLRSNIRNPQTYEVNAEVFL